MQQQVIDRIFTVLKETYLIEVEASGRHVHLSQDAADFLFGENYVFQKAKDLSQPGQFACKERVDLMTPGGVIKNVAILGPVRPETQVEISMTDARMLKINPPIRLSGDTKDTPGITICANGRKLSTAKGVIIAKRHIHLTPGSAKRFGVSDKESVRVKLFSDRPLIFDDTIVRVSEKFHDDVHIDFDEANACGYTKNTYAVIQKTK